MKYQIVISDKLQILMNVCSIHAFPMLSVVMLLVLLYVHVSVAILEMTFNVKVGYFQLKHTSNIYCCHVLFHAIVVHALCS